MLLNTTNILDSDLFEVYVDDVMIAVYGSEVFTLENIYFGSHHLRVKAVNNHQDYFPNAESIAEVSFIITQLTYDGYVGLFYVSPSPTINLHTGNIFTDMNSLSTLSYYEEVVTLIQNTLFSDNPQFIAPISVDNISVENLETLQEIETRCVEAVIWGDNYIASEFDLDARKWNINLQPLTGIVSKGEKGSRSLQLSESFFGRVNPGKQKIIISGYYGGYGEEVSGQSYVYFESLITGYINSNIIILEDEIPVNIKNVSFTIEYMIEEDELISEYFIDHAGNKNIIISNTQSYILVEVPLGSDIMLQGKWGVIKVVDDA